MSNDLNLSEEVISKLSINSKKAIKGNNPLSKYMIKKIKKEVDNIIVDVKPNEVLAITKKVEKKYVFSKEEAIEAAKAGIGKEFCKRGIHVKQNPSMWNGYIERECRVALNISIPFREIVMNSINPYDHEEVIVLEKKAGSDRIEFLNKGQTIGWGLRGFNPFDGEKNKKIKEFLDKVKGAKSENFCQPDFFKFYSEKKHVAIYGESMNLLFPISMSDLTTAVRKLVYSIQGVDPGNRFITLT